MVRVPEREGGTRDQNHMAQKYKQTSSSKWESEHESKQSIKMEGQVSSTNAGRGGLDRGVVAH